MISHCLQDDFTRTGPFVSQSLLETSDCNNKARSTARYVFIMKVFQCYLFFAEFY